METNNIIETLVNDKEAITKYKVLDTVISKRFNFLNLVELHPKTGRKHQLRIHLSTIGNQILGDKDYGNKELILKGKGMYLHASSLKFIHPFTQKELFLKIALPKKFIKIFPKKA